MPVRRGLRRGAARRRAVARQGARLLSPRRVREWDPRAQRPEPWGLYNTRIRSGEHLRVFPLSNWTELDVWRYIAREGLELPALYFAHTRTVIERAGLIWAIGEHFPLLPGESAFSAEVRYRTVGDMTCTAAVRSSARTLAEVIAEVAASPISERGATRADDQASEAAMEDRKREGYF
ncbi:MAG TPA: sulfate adenylyltransferase subunit CysD [Thermomicrobiales bacterium]|nr:sulfate adenylyltransferase subunit CysD [Thermomicrobiales bacterium]